MDAALRMPGYQMAIAPPIRTRIDMLTTGVRTPVGIKVFGNDLAEIERVSIALEGMLRDVPGTRSTFAERQTGREYIDIVPDREAIARYGLTRARRARRRRGRRRRHGGLDRDRRPLAVLGQPALRRRLPRRSRLRCAASSSRSPASEPVGEVELGGCGARCIRRAPGMPSAAAASGGMGAMGGGGGAPAAASSSRVGELAVAAWAASAACDATRASAFGSSARRFRSARSRTFAS